MPKYRSAVKPRKVSGSPHPTSGNGDEHARERLEGGGRFCCPKDHTGHESAAVSANCTHVGVATDRGALRPLSDITS
jgi:hypothetical protein